MKLLIKPMNNLPELLQSARERFYENFPTKEQIYEGITTPSGSSWRFTEHFAVCLDQEITLAYEKGKEDGFYIGYEKGNNIQLEWAYLSDEEKQKALLTLTSK